VCRKWRLNGAVLCHSRCNTIKIRVQRPWAPSIGQNFAALHRKWWCLHKWKKFEREAKRSINQSINQSIYLVSIHVTLRKMTFISFSHTHYIPCLTLPWEQNINVEENEIHNIGWGLPALQHHFVIDTIWSWYQTRQPKVPWEPKRTRQDALCCIRHWRSK
jgi:hypothetical protein